MFNKALKYIMPYQFLIGKFMSQVSIRFDPQIFTEESPLNNINGKKGSRFGYYQHGNSYVFTTEAVFHKNVKFVTDLTKIAQIFNRVSLKDVKLAPLSLQKQIKTIEYLFFIHLAIQKRNSKLDQIKQSKVVKFLLLIPVINFVLYKWLKHTAQFFGLTQSLFASTLKEHFVSNRALNEIHNYSHLFENIHCLDDIKREIAKIKLLVPLHPFLHKDQEAIERYFASFDALNIEDCKNSLLHSVNEFFNSYPFLKVPEIEKQMIQNIEIGYANRIKKLYPNLETAEKILENEKTGPHLLHRTLLNSASADSLQETVQSYFSESRLLQPSPHLPPAFKHTLEDALLVLRKSLSVWIRARFMFLWNAITNKLSESVRMKREDCFSNTNFSDHVEYYLDCVRFLENFFSMIQDPTGFSNQFKALSSGELIQKKKQWLEDLAKLASHNQAFRESDLCQQMGEYLENYFDQQLIECHPVLQKANRILNIYDDTPRLLYQLVLKLDDNASSNQASLARQEVLDALRPEESWSNALKNYVERAKELVDLAYTKWHVQKWLLMKTEEEKLGKIHSIFSLLGSDDPSTLGKIYVHWIKKLNTSDTQFQQVLSYLTTHYELYLREQLGCFMNIETFPDRLIPAANVFNRKSSLEELKIQKQRYLAFFKEWDEFQKNKPREVNEGKEDNEEMVSFVEKGGKLLNLAYQAELCARFPLYAKACEVLEKFSPEVSIWEIFESPREQCRELLKEIDPEIAARQNLPPEVLDKIKEANELLGKRYAKLEADKIQEKQVAKKVPLTPENLWSKVSKLVGTGDKVIEKSLRRYKKELLYLLDIANEADIEARYQHLSKLWSSDHPQRQALDTAYANYKRSIRLQPLTVVILEKKRSFLVLNDLFPSQDLSKISISEVEAYKTQLLTDIKTEIEIQSILKKEALKELSSILEFFSQAGKMLDFFWEEYSRDSLPVVYEELS